MRCRWVISSRLFHTPVARPARYAAPRAVVSRMAGRSTSLFRMSDWNCIRKWSRLAPPSTFRVLMVMSVSFSMAHIRSALW